MLVRVLLFLAVGLTLTATGQSRSERTRAIERVTRVARLLGPFASGERTRFSTQLVIVERFQKLVSSIDVSTWEKAPRTALFQPYETVWGEWSKQIKNAKQRSRRSGVIDRIRALEAEHNKICDQLGQLTFVGVVDGSIRALPDGDFAEVLGGTVGRLKTMGFRGPRDRSEEQLAAKFIAPMKDRVSTWSVVRKHEDVRRDLDALGSALELLSPSDSTVVGAELAGYLNRVVTEATNPKVPAERRRPAYALLNPLYALLLSNKLVENGVGLRKSLLEPRLSWVPVRFAAKDCTLDFSVARVRARADRFQIAGGVCTGVRFRDLSGHEVIDIPDLGIAEHVFLVPRDLVRIRYRLPERLPEGGPAGATREIWVRNLNNKTGQRITPKFPAFGISGFEFVQTSTRFCWVSRKPVSRARIKAGCDAMLAIERGDPRVLERQFATLWTASHVRSDKGPSPEKIDDAAWMAEPFMIDRETYRRRADFKRTLFGTTRSILSMQKRFVGERLPDRVLASELGTLSFLSRGLVDSELAAVPKQLEDPKFADRTDRPIHTVILMK